MTHDSRHLFPYLGFDLKYRIISHCSHYIYIYMYILKKNPLINFFFNPWGVRFSCTTLILGGLRGVFSFLLFVATPSLSGHTCEQCVACGT